MQQDTEETMLCKSLITQLSISAAYIEANRFEEAARANRKAMELSKMLLRLLNVDVTANP